MSPNRLHITLAAAAIMLAGCCCSYPAVDDAAFAAAFERSSHVTRQRPPGVPQTDSTTLVEMRGVHFRIDPRLPLEIRRLRGRMHPLPGFDVIDFGNSDSFVIEIASAEVGLSAENMRYLFNSYVFAYPDAPLTLHAMSVEDGYIIQQGTLHQVVDIPFEMKAELTATRDGRLRLTPVDMRICSIPGKGLMEALGIELENLMDLSGATGVDVEGNDLLIDATAILPPPAIRGRITEVRVEDGQVVQVFDSGEAIDIPEPSDPSAENYMFFSGGTLAFGKLFMIDADLQIVDDDPADPFDFFLMRYLEQLVAGRSQTMPDAGLMAIFPDYADIPAASN